jgi:hypothetical protein
MSDEHNFPPEPVRRRRTPAGQALAVVVVALLVGSLLNADRLDHTAHTQPFGWQRNLAIGLTGPLKDLSHATRLDRPRKWMSERAGNTDPPPPQPTEAVVTVPLDDEGRPVAPTSTTTTLPYVAPTPTAADPVRILVIGDSLMGWIGPAVTQALDGKPIDVTEDWQVATGLARPDKLNWPAQAKADMEQHDPNVVIMGFGGNDAQDMSTADGTVKVGTKEWRAEYQRRVAQMLTAVEGRGRTVYWIGLPITTRANIEASAPLMAQAVKAEISARPWAHYIDTLKTLSPDGKYVTYLPTPDGNGVKVREDDGVHPNLAGASRMVAPMVQAIRKERKLG